MNIKTITIGKNQVSEIESQDVIIRNTQDVLDIIGEIQYGDVVSEHIILHDYNFEKDFFDLSTRKLGDILQKFTNYRVKLAVIGNFDTYPSKTLKDFIYESNRHGDYLFVSSMDQVQKAWNT